jgi:two-component SAPR family response regulator
LISKVKEKCPELPIIMATGYAELDGDAANIPRLVKPFLQDQLEGMIAKMGVPKSRG